VIELGQAYCIAAGKGGIGNTTVCGNLALATGMLGHKVLVVDTDPDDTLLSLMYGGDIGIISPKDLVSKKVSIDDIVTTDGNRHIDLVKVAPFPMDAPDIFPEFVSYLKDKYDLVFIDVPPGLGQSVKETVSACDRVLLVTNPNVPSVIFTLKVKWMAEELRRKPIGVVVNKMGTKHDVPTEYIRDLIDLDIVGEINEASEAMDALQKNKPLFEEYPDCSASQEVGQIAERLKRI
jgi:septum site-determining protein MinD